MSEHSREFAFAVVGLAFIAGGIVFDTFASGIETRARARPEGGISARAAFCPPSSADAGSAVSVSAAGVADSDVTVGVDPVAPEPAELAAGTSLATKIPEGRPSEVIGYGHPVLAGGLVSATGPVRGAAAGTCSSVAASEWFFAAGSAALESDERILLYNPFPDEAVVRLNLYTPKGLETRTSLQDVPVPARSWEEIGLNEAIRVRGTVGARVVAKRGRVVAWREMFTKAGERPRSQQLTLGVPELRESWYFADGAIGPGVDEAIGLLNPTGREAIVSVRITTSRETLQPQKLLEYPVPRRSAVAVALEDFIKEPEEFAGASVTVASVNGVGVAAERIVYYSTDDVSGGAAEAGATGPHKAWLLPAATASPDDDGVALMNPTSQPVSVELTILGADSGKRPASLRGIEIAPGSRMKIQVQDHNGGGPVAVMAVGSGRFVAERYAYSPDDADVAVVGGIPFVRLAFGP
jgi:hypothetical protein